MTVILPNSPIEFVMIGPSGGRDRVLVRSEKSGSDLIGLAVLFEDDTERPIDFLSRILGYPRPINVVSSAVSPDIFPDIDRRSSKFRFAWKGYISRRGIMGVREKFRRTIPDASLALKAENVEDVELALAPLIYECNKENERTGRLRLFILTAIALYLIISIFALLFFEINRHRAPTSAPTSLDHLQYSRA